MIPCACKHTHAHTSSLPLIIHKVEVGDNVVHSHTPDMLLLFHINNEAIESVCVCVRGSIMQQLCFMNVRYTRDMEVQRSAKKINIITSLYVLKVNMSCVGSEKLRMILRLSAFTNNEAQLEHCGISFWSSMFPPHGNLTNRVRSHSPHSRQRAWGRSSVNKEQKYHVMTLSGAGIWSSQCKGCKLICWFTRWSTPTAQTRQEA